jgi:hypothetical protein
VSLSLLGRVLATIRQDAVVESGDDIVVPADSAGSTPTRWQRYQAWNDRSGATVNRWAWRYFAPILCLLMIIIAAPSIRGAYEARLGSGGVPGMFTVLDVNCDARGGCDASGFFTDAQGNERDDVEWGGSARDLAVFDEVPAVDVGDAHFVYPPGSGNLWLGLTICLAGGVAGLAWWSVDMTRRLRRRRAAPTLEHEAASISGS